MVQVQIHETASSLASRCTGARTRKTCEILSRDGTPANAEHRLALELVILRELRLRPHHVLHWIATDQMLADPLTKSFTTPTYLLERLREGRWCLTDNPKVAKHRQQERRRANPTKSKL